MVKLYKYNKRLDRWMFVDYGIKSKSELYAKQGYVVLHK